MSFWKKVGIGILFLSLLVMTPKVILAQSDGGNNGGANDSQNFEATVTKIDEEKQIEFEGQKQLYQKVELVLNTGPDKNKQITIENGKEAMANVVKYQKGDRVIVTEDQDPQGNNFYAITDFIRRTSLLILVIVFVGLILIVTRWKGFASLLSMSFTFWILFIYVLPQLSAGQNPLVIASIASLIIIPISFYVAHGISKKTTVAIVGSLIALLVTAILAFIFIDMGKLTGLSSEEAGMLSIDRQGGLNMKGLLLAGIVIGALGILNDITISQAAVVNELIKVTEKPKPMTIYKEAMNVGRDHIASMVNTLILAYAGVSLPLLLIFINNDHPFLEIINYEFLAEEIIRTLIGAIGLILAVPITTFIAVYWIKKKKERL
jgi:uncharacterized membrane protein